MAIDRRQFTGALVATLFLGKGWNAPAELPACPESFVWKRSPALEAFVPCPADWHFHEENHNGSKTAYFTREDFAATNQFLTGFVVNVAPKMDGDVTIWCKAFLQVCLEGIAPLEMFEVENEEYLSAGFEKINPPKGYRTKEMRIRVVGVANKLTNTLYLVQFESPADRWEADWPIGELIYEMFKINADV